MTKAKKLPSGRWRVQTYDKGERRSFTGDTKKQAELMAAEYLASRRAAPADMTVGEAALGYIEIKKAVLSPTTTASYREILKNRFGGIAGVCLKDLDQIKVQEWAGRLANTAAPKTVKNAHGFLAAVLGLYAPSMRLNTKLPTVPDPELYVPSDADVKKLLGGIRGSNLEVAVLLAAFGPMRRGEICALEGKDVDGARVAVSKAMKWDGEAKEWVVGNVKTKKSERVIEFPQFVADRIAGIEGRVCPLTPNSVTEMFAEKLEALGLPHFRFHDLRHYSASIMHAMGVPEAYIMKRGGWGDATPSARSTGTRWTKRRGRRTPP
jgi:integrase